MRDRPWTDRLSFVAAVGGSAAIISVALTGWAVGSTSTRMLPWVLGRGLGIAAYAALVALTVLGLWLRHPWRLARPVLPPTTHMRLHATLAAATLVLVLGHVVALVLDRFAGVGLVGALVPGHSAYRMVPVALGTLGVYVGLLVGGTAALAGRIVGRSWLPIHRLASLSFVLIWLHGVLAGSDTRALRVMYAATGFAVTFLALSRRLAPSPAAERPALP
jgi:predicted ferric reductase